MALTLLELKAVAKHELGGDPEAIYTDADTVKQQIVNEAGRFMVNMHPWSWRLRSAYPLTARAPITITGGTWTNGTLTLTKTGAFANYTFRVNDLIAITGGTGATAGTYIVSSRTSDDAIVLSTTIGSGADGQTDIAATFDQVYMALPSDFAEMVDLIPSDSLTNSFTRTSVADIRRRRARNVVNSGNIFSWALVHPAGAAETDNLAAQAIEIYPNPPSDDTDFARLTYRAAWTDLTADTDKPKIPDDLEYESLLVQCVREFASYHDDERREAYDNILGSVLFEQLKKRDGRFQSNIGMIEGGMLQESVSGSSKPYTTYTDPS